jgi:hypothetical protein
VSLGPLAFAANPDNSEIAACNDAAERSQLTLNAISGSRHDLISVLDLHFNAPCLAGVLALRNLGVKPENAKTNPPMA